MNSLCHTPLDGDTINSEYNDYPLYDITIYGDKPNSLKIAKRIVCATKNLPLKITLHYEHDTNKAIEMGIEKDPTVFLNKKIFFEGLIQAEEIEKLFRDLKADTMPMLRDLPL